MNRFIPAIVLAAVPLVTAGCSAGDAKTKDQPAIRAVAVANHKDRLRRHLARGAHTAARRLA